MTNKQERFEKMSGLVGKNLYIRGFKGVKDVLDYNAHLYYVVKVSSLYLYLYRYEMDNVEEVEDINDEINEDCDIIYKHFINDKDDDNIIKVLISQVHDRYIVVEGSFKNIYFKQVKKYYKITVEILDNYRSSLFYKKKTMKWKAANHL